MIRTADDFRAWMAAMGRRRGKPSISVRAAEIELGYSRASIAKILRGERPVPKCVGLACRALILDVPEVDPSELAEGQVYKVRLIKAG